MREEENRLSADEVKSRRQIKYAVIILSFIELVGMIAIFVKKF